MPKQSNLVPELELNEIDAYKKDVDTSLRRYFAQLPPDLQERLIGKTPSEVAAELQSRLDESDTRSAFFVLTSLEATFKIDFDTRCTNRKRKNSLSEHFRDLKKKHGKGVSLEKGILRGWERHSTGPSGVISQVRDAFKFRHWLAHGRYWVRPRRYDVESVYLIALRVSAFLDAHQL